MLDQFKKRLRQLKTAAPGERFRRSYETRKESGSPAVRIAFVVIGAALIVVGVVLLAIPGPGLLVIALGAALIAQEFRWAANGLDKLELFLRKRFKKLEAFWKKASMVIRAMIVVVAAALAAGAAYFGYLWFIRG